VRQVGTKLDKHAFSFAGPRALNLLPKSNLLAQPVSTEGDGATVVYRVH